jgi:HAD superfamily hydrolase (TIGR01459 family)
LLTKLELTSQHYDQLITSGDIFLEDVAKTPLLQKPFYYIGDPVLHAPLLAQLQTPTKDLSTAAYVLCSAVPPNYPTILQEALAQEKLLVCVNPDLIVIEDGRTKPCAGSVAQEYAQQGGAVSYYGKPHEKTYDHVFEGLGNPPKEKVLMIGDSLYTDILGGNTYGIDTLLVNTGVHRVTDLPNPDQALEKLSRDLGMEPTYFLETLGKK